MTPEQQFLIAQQQIAYAFYGAIVVGVFQVLGLLLTYLKASSTHTLVNSELAEWKRLFKATADQAAIDARAAGVKEGSATK